MEKWRTRMKQFTKKDFMSKEHARELNKKLIKFLNNKLVKEQFKILNFLIDITVSVFKFIKTKRSIVVCESASLDPSSLVPTHGDATSSLVRVDVI